MRKLFFVLVAISLLQPWTWYDWAIDETSPYGNQWDPETEPKMNPDGPNADKPTLNAPGSNSGSTGGV